MSSESLEKEVIVIKEGVSSTSDTSSADSSDLGVTFGDVQNEEISPEMDKRLLNIADRYVLPFVACVYGLQMADKIIPSGAAILHLKTDLFSNSKTGFSWVGSSLYLGYLVFEFPLSYAMQRFPLVPFLSSVVVAWGILVTCTAACTNMESFLACRTLLGVLESVTQPALVAFTVQWYKRSEMFSRTCFWVSANGAGSLLVVGIAYALAYYSENDENYYGMRPWKLLYIIMGLITILFGVLCYVFVPNSPQVAKFMTEEEKAAHALRISANQQSSRNRQIKRYQIKEAFLDIRTWLYGIAYLLGSLPNGGLNIFTTLIIQGQGYLGKDALLMNLPTSATELVGLLVAGLFSIYVIKNSKLIITIFASSLAVASLCLVAWGPSSDSQMAGICLYMMAGPLAFVGLIALVGSDSAGYTKKVTASAFILVCFCIGNIVGPQAFLESEAPHYPTGKIVMAATQAGQLFFIILIAILNVWENRRRDRAGIFEPPSDSLDAETEDLTDREMPWFRYSM